MPRTPAPLTVEHDSTIGADLWLAVSYAKTRVVIATFKQEADARAFVALPALIEAVTNLLELGRKDTSNPKYDGYYETVRAALAQADGPAPTEEEK